MYPPHSFSAIQFWYQPTLFPCPAQEKRRKICHAPAFVLTKNARIAVLSVRQYLGYQLTHPDDLWRHKDRHRGIREVSTRNRGGRDVDFRLSLDAGGDAQVFRRIRDAEDKWRVAADAVEYLAALETRIDEVAKLVLAPERVLVGQILDRMDRLTAFRAQNEED